tara:strand:+ start:1617 stop:2165 length:549 start_codon:yes stop_codon:yes gene_type:complete
MADPIQSFRTRVRGFWTKRHEVLDSEGRTLGTLTVRRNKWSMVVGGEYRPEQGEVLSIRRDPGLLRAQFSVWTESREWLASSLRWHVAQRQIQIEAGSKKHRLVPQLGLRSGWRLMATKTGEVANFKLGFRKATLHVNRKMDFELLLFCYFLGTMTPLESIWPTALDLPERSVDGKAATSQS